MRQCNTRYDEVWVPSAFHLKAFTDSGVKAEKVHVIPEVRSLLPFPSPLALPLHPRGLHAALVGCRLLSSARRRPIIPLLRAHRANSPKLMTLLSPGAVRLSDCEHRGV